MNQQKTITMEKYTLMSYFYFYLLNDLTGVLYFLTFTIIDSLLNNNKKKRVLSHWTIH
jgi:hypothetical protein